MFFYQNKAGSYDFTGEDSDPSPEANNSHGTKYAIEFVIVCV